MDLNWFCQNGFACSGLRAIGSWFAREKNGDERRETANAYENTEMGFYCRITNPGGPELEFPCRLPHRTDRGKYLWATAFLAVGVLFNPVLPIVLPRNTFVTLELVSLVLFAVSLAALKRTPRPSIASITDPTPGSESL
jgi:hypothetical protein